jgi:hypothetical protein
MAHIDKNATSILRDATSRYHVTTMAFTSFNTLSRASKFYFLDEKDNS